MATRFRPYEPDQMALMPAKPSDWLPADHLAHHVRDIGDHLDLEPFYAPYAGDGRRNSPYSPKMMVTILIYGYATGVRSSRKIAQRLHEDVAFRMLAAKNFPAHRTICEFRRGIWRTFGTCFWRWSRSRGRWGWFGSGRCR